MGLVKNSMPCTLKLTRRVILEPNISVCWSKTQKNTGGGVGGIQLGAADPGVFNSNVTPKNADVRQVRTAGGVSLEWSDVTRE